MVYKSTLKDLIQEKQETEYRPDPARFYNVQYEPEFDHQDAAQMVR